jgi:hypothetical protein
MTEAIKNKGIFFGLIIFLGMFVSPMLSAQMVLQLEKTGSVKKVRYYVGDIIEFKTIHLPETWQRRMITDIRPNESVFISDSDRFNVASITHIRREASTGQIVSLFLYSAGISSLLASTGFLIRGIQPAVSWYLVVGIPVGAIITAWLVRKYWKYKVYPVGSKRRLRTLDLSFYPTNSFP